MTNGFTITLTVPDEDRRATRIVHKSNWDGKGIAFARADWTTVRQRDDFDRPGVYILVLSESGSALPEIYVGEADLLRQRLNGHYANTDFWAHAVAFVGSRLNKAIIKYLESRLLTLAAEAKRARIRNTNWPPLPAHSEAMGVEAEAFLSEMLSLYPVLGVDAFLTSAAHTASDTLRIDRGGVLAYGREESLGFVVEAGSSARLEDSTHIGDDTKALRAELEAAGILIRDGDVLRFAQAHVFSSPSSAAGAILAGSVNGRTEWHDERGRTLRDLQRAAASRGQD